jgi:hypothetical protein
MNDQHAPEPSALRTAGDSNLHRARLERFFQQNAPEKISTIDRALELYKGREERMFEILVMKYGPETPT